MPETAIVICHCYWYGKGQGVGFLKAERDGVEREERRLADTAVLLLQEGRV